MDSENYSIVSKSDLLRDRVVDLVREFIKTEGGITGHDLRQLFGEPTSLVAHALAGLFVRFDN